MPQKKSGKFPLFFCIPIIRPKPLWHSTTKDNNTIPEPRLSSTLHYPVYQQKTRVTLCFTRVHSLYQTVLDCSLVPTARLELARLSPLPPQDSVSTNSTTSAQELNYRSNLIFLQALCVKNARYRIYFEAFSPGLPGTVAAPGIAAAPEASLPAVDSAGASCSGAGAVTDCNFSITLLCAGAR